MKAIDLATRDVQCIHPHQSLDAAIALMEEHAIHHLPVVQDGNVLGMVSDRDLLLAVGWKTSTERRLDDSDRDVAGPRRVEQIMSRPVVTVSAQ